MDRAEVMQWRKAERQGGASSIRIVGERVEPLAHQRVHNVTGDAT
jgi:hypothetical protein